MNEIINACREILDEYQIMSYDIVEILSKENADGSIGYQIKVSEHDNFDALHLVNLNRMNCPLYEKIPEWDYDLDTHLFDDLEHRFEVVYIPLKQHYLIWTYISHHYEEIERKEGLYRYLDYCKFNHITKKTLSKLDADALDVPDVMTEYKEINRNYEIIDEHTAGNVAIVLAYNPKSPSPYVTWRTTPLRMRGFDMGHYFSNYAMAYNDFIQRSMDITEKYLKSKFFQKKIHHNKSLNER